MDNYATALWKHAPSIVKLLEGVESKSSEDVKTDLMALLGLSIDAPVVVEDPRPGVEDFEQGLLSAIIACLESDDASKIARVADMLRITSSIVVEVFRRAARPGVQTAETERCKSWWTMLFSVAEDAARLVPTRLLDRLVQDWEELLVNLRAAYLELAMQRLAEFDAKAGEEVAEKKDDETRDGKRSADQKTGRDDQRSSKDGKEARERRVEERKKLIAHLGISPNGQLYLTLTSLLKQLSSRLCNSLHAPLRARIVLLLERLLAMDHKAIANNQKFRSQDFVQLEDLDLAADAVFLSQNGESGAPAGGVEAEIQAESAAPTVDETVAGSGEAEVTNGHASSNGRGLGSDPMVDFEFYRSFWGLQEFLQYPERAIDKQEQWAKFREALRRVLDLFEKYQVQETSNQPWSKAEPTPLRHAPRARALAVQLEDPGFRQQFLTQVLIAFQAVGKRGDSSGLLAKQSEVLRAEFNDLKRKCEALLAHTRPGFPALLQHALDREGHWVNWKIHGCREFESESLEMLNARSQPADSLPSVFSTTSKPKPQLAPYINGLLRTLKDPQWKEPAASTSSDEEAAKSMRLHATWQRCDAYLDRLIEDEKPENAIDDEYKAKRNKVFMWQCRRLFCQQYLRVYAQKDAGLKTDFMDFVQIVKGKVPSAAEDATSKQDEEAADAREVSAIPEASAEPEQSEIEPVASATDSAAVNVPAEAAPLENSEATAAPPVAAAVAAPVAAAVAAPAAAVVEADPSAAGPPVPDSAASQIASVAATAPGPAKREAPEETPGVGDSGEVSPAKRLKK